ncbi:MAG: RDD family protein [Lachnospiraceae bacterium]|nr:RDD family protein [Lachnospiraceae bacterium]
MAGIWFDYDILTICTQAFRETVKDAFEVGIIKEKENVMSDLAYRRVAAFIIDYVILCIVFFFVGMCGVILVMFRAEPIRTEAMNKIFENDMMLVFFFICLFFAWIYFFLLDYWENIDVGKKLTGIELLSDNQKLTVSKKMKHSILKCIFMAIWPISFTYYLVKQQMIYDKYLKISVIMKE